MSKGMHRKKNSKKKPARILLEKRGEAGNEGRQTDAERVAMSRAS